MKSNFTKLTILLIAFASSVIVVAQNPIKRDFGMADPHIYIFNDKAYLFATRDADTLAKRFNMPDWHIWSSDDMVEWRYETLILPTETYMGSSTSCWATETAERNGKYYFYFSNGNRDTGVMVASQPEGPYVDVLGKPLLDKDLTSGQEYDPSVIEVDGEYYIIFGHHAPDRLGIYYHIARLNEDMISLAEEPRAVKIINDKCQFPEDDKPNLHKHRGLIYLTVGSCYAVATDVYGPYKSVGITSDSEQYGFGTRAHGNFFERKNQWFNTWCHFYKGKSVALFRESYITYLHYRKNGEMVCDSNFMDQHFANGVGSYSADWSVIEAEWFMEAKSGDMKRESCDGGFEVVANCSGDYVAYPNMRDLDSKNSISLKLKSSGSGEVYIRRDSPNGKVLAKCSLPNTNGSYQDVSCSIKSQKRECDLYFVFAGDNVDCVIDSFMFK